MALSNEQKQWVRDLEVDGSTYLGAANQTAYYDEESGEVETNIEGLNRYLYTSLEDFIEHALEGNFVPHKHSVYIGNRESGSADHDDPKAGVDFNSEYDPETMTIDEDEDGSSVYSSFIDVSESD